MKYLITGFIAAGLFMLSCNKESNDVVYYKAVVADVHDLSCSLPLLDFSDDSVAIRKLTGNASLKYVVVDLPDSLNLLNKKIYVAATTLKPEDYFVCNTFGINYPSLKIINAKER